MPALPTLRHLLPAAAAAAIVAGCGGSAAGPSAATAPAGEAPRLRLLQSGRAPGEIVVRGESSPASHGPFTFDGRYTVRFEQVAPEEPDLDFGTQTAFVAMANRRAEEEGAGTIRLFNQAARTGTRRVTLRGRLYVDVSFGDFPYAIRFTPDPGR
jgi:hypothetical protein